MSEGGESEPFLSARRVLLDERRPLEHFEVMELARQPLDRLPDLVALAHEVRLDRNGPTVALEALVNARSGACPEDCTFCSQSSHYRTGADVTRFLGTELVVAAAARARESGASHFCIVVSGRGPDERLLARVIEVVGAIREETGLAVACSLGLLEREQAQRLAAAGVGRYNHNLETCREHFPRVCATHGYDDRLRTARLVQEVGMELCCGGILGIGESLEQRVDLAFELAALQPDEVPLNFLDPRPGTPMGERALLPAREALRTIGLFRLVLPESAIRLAGGRERVLGELQAMGLYAGANALVVGDYLTTEGRPPNQDVELLESLGMPVAGGPTGARYVVESQTGRE